MSHYVTESYPEPSQDEVSEDGSLPLALLAVIVVAGIVSVLLSRVVAGEGAARFDRDFAEAVHTADVGINRGLFALNEGLVPVGATDWPATAPAPTTVDGVSYEWGVTQVGSRQWEITSRSTTPSGVSRLLVAEAEDQPRFIQGAFADEPLGLNGASTTMDSYNSNPACTIACWGPNTDFAEQFGTGNATFGSNEQLRLHGNLEVAPGSGYLYDWEDNPGSGSPQPFGERTVGDSTADSCVVTGGPNNTVCTTEFVSTVDPPHPASLPSRTQFIWDVFESGPCSEDDSPHWLPDTALGSTVLDSYANVSDEDPGPSNPTEEGFSNFYCIEDLEFADDVVLSHEVTTENPVIIFVRDSVIVKNQVSVACHTYSPTALAPPAGSDCDADHAQKADDARLREVRPQAARLQIYVAPLGEANVSFRAGSEFAGVLYAPKSTCNDNGETHFFGSLMCGEIDMTGNFNFHYDDGLGVFGSGFYAVASWQERAP